MESELIELEARRRQKAAQTQIDFSGRVSPESEAGTVEGMEDLFGRDHWIVRHREQCGKFESEFNRRFAEAAAIYCPVHPTFLMSPDPEESLRASYATLAEDGSWKLKRRFFDCPVCTDEMRDAALRVRLESQGVPGDLLHARLNNWEARSDMDRAAMEKVKEFAKVPRGTLILISPTFGNGKSHLAVACLAERKEGRFITQNQFIADLRAEYGAKGRPRIVARLQETPLLVIDELGLTTGGRDELPAIHEVLTKRYGQRLPTIITGNFAKTDEMREVLGGRMFDRLRESTFASVILSGTSMRRERRDQYLSASALDNPGEDA